MSSFLLNCPNCNTELEADVQDIGKNARCQICDYHFVISKEEATSEVAVQVPNTALSDISQVEKKDSALQKCITLLWGGAWIVLGSILWSQQSSLWGPLGSLILGSACLLYGLFYIVLKLKRKDKHIPATKKTQEVNNLANQPLEDLNAVITDSSHENIVPKKECLDSNVEKFTEKENPVKTDQNFDENNLFEDEVKEIKDENNGDENNAQCSNSDVLMRLKDNKVEQQTSELTSPKSASMSTEYVLPPIGFLSHSNNNCKENTEKISIMINSIEKVFKSLGILGEVADYTVAPHIINFEISLAPGINVRKVEQNAESIAQSLAIPNIRIVAPIPGRSVIRVEVPKNELSDVYLRDILESKQCFPSDAQLPIALGKNVQNKPVFLDLATSSPMLIAGGPGSGKSVCVNSLIMSLILHFSPDELKFIMVDPSVVELSAYNTLPHLLTPVISHNLEKLPKALEWTVKEMEKRYRLMSAVRVKSFSEFNKRPLSSFPNIDDDGNLIPEKMPALVLVMDSANDSIIAEIKKDVEKFITRIAQRGQRAGIYLVIVAQRPTVNIISGTIKANFLSSLCFKVRSFRDSLIAIETAGGEKLLGNGDMLCQVFSTRSIERVQGAFTPASDILKVVDFVSAQASPKFNKAVLGEDDNDDNWDRDDDEENVPWDNGKDDMALVKKYLRPGDSDVMREALEVVILERKASTSYLQRRLGIGYNRASELIDLMENRGLVGPPSGIGTKRNILVFDDLVL